MKAGFLTRVLSVAPPGLLPAAVIHFTNHSPTRATCNGSNAANQSPKSAARALMEML